MATPVIERGDPMNAGEDGEEGEGEEEEEEEEEGKGLGHVFLGVRENA